MRNLELEFEAEIESLVTRLSDCDLESEIAESNGEAEFSPFRAARDLWVIGGQGGQRDENKLTDAVFYDRHPDWKGRSLKNAVLPLRQEWIGIRDGVVRPYLQNYPAQPPAPLPPSPASAPSPSAPSRAAQDPFGFSQFSNILKYESYKYPMAIAAQNAYRKVSGFQTYYNRINTLWPQVSISLDEHGIGNLVFSINGRAFADSMESDELKQKAHEIMGGGLTSSGGVPEDRIIFEEDVIGMLGLGLTMLDLAQGLNRERMVGGVGPEYDKWRAKQQLQFTFSLVAEDWTRKPWGPLQFINRDPRSLAVELANRYAEFQPVFYDYANYYNREHDLGLYEGSVPDRVPPTMGPAAGP